MKFNSNGQSLWNYTINPSSGSDQASGVSLDSQDNIIVVGYDSNTTNGDRQWRIMKFDSNGQPIWSYTTNESINNDQANDVIIDSQDNIIVVGFDRQLVNEQWRIMKFNSNGQSLWNYTINPSSGVDQALSVANDSWNNIIVAGYDIQPGNYQWRIMKFTPNGQVLWNYTDNASSSTDQANGVTADSQDNIIVVGFDRIEGNDQWRIMKFKPNLPDGYSCNSGNDCQSNVCVNGICGYCTSGNGEQCSWDGDDGACVKDIADGENGYTYNNWNFATGADPTDLVYYNGYIYTVERRGTNPSVVANYSSGGAYIGDLFSIEAKEPAPGGIDFDGTYFYITGDSDKVFKYTSGGTYVSEFNLIQTGTNINIPSGVRFDGTYFWVTDSHLLGTSEVYKYDSSGTYISSFSVHSQENIPDGIDVTTNYVYVVGITTDRVYRYNKDGTYTYWNFSVDSTSGPSGDAFGLSLTPNKKYFYVVDYGDTKVYRFEANPTYPCDYDEVCYVNPDYWADCSQCNNNDACDSNVDFSGYSRDGSCQGVNCCLFALGGSHGTSCDLDSDCNIANACGNTGGSASCTASEYEVVSIYDCLDTCACNIPSSCYGHEGSGTYYQTACLNCGNTGYYDSDGWNGDTSDYCCDDGDDYRRTSQAQYLDNGYGSGDGTIACCLASTDCVDGGQCTDTTQTKDADGDGDLDYCNAGTWVDCTIPGHCGSGETCQSNDCVSNYLIIDSIQILPSGVVNPIENSTIIMNVTVNVTNSTNLDKCIIKIFNASGSYQNPTIGPIQGTIGFLTPKTYCFGSWNMEYWRNPGEWNVTVWINLTTGTINTTSQNFTYNELVSAISNVTYVNFSGLPGQTVNSISAYPMSIKNGGNVKVNVSINGTDLKGETDQTRIIIVRNITYNETTTGVFRSLNYSYHMVFPFLTQTQEKNIYFRVFIPIGFPAQYYNNTIEIKGVKS